jgi:hypothetical protein
MNDPEEARQLATRLDNWARERDSNGLGPHPRKDCSDAAILARTHADLIDNLEEFCEVFRLDPLVDELSAILQAAAVQPHPTRRRRPMADDQKPCPYCVDHGCRGGCKCGACHGSGIAPPTGAERYLSDRLADPEYREAYAAAAVQPPDPTPPPNPCIAQDCNDGIVEAIYCGHCHGTGQEP